MLTAKMSEYIKWFRESGVEPFFHRKSNRVVLALLHLEINGSSHYVRGINSEVSLPTGSICAERAAIIKARTEIPGLKRSHMKGIAVIDVTNELFENVEDISMNPLPPCGACREWLEKVQEESEQFYVLTYSGIGLHEVHERFLFWAEQEESVVPEDLGRWACRMCATQNVPFTSVCRTCAANRFSMHYNRVPHQARFYSVLHALWKGGPMTPRSLLRWLQDKGIKLGESSDEHVENQTVLLKILGRLEKNSRLGGLTGEKYGGLVSRDSKGRYTVTNLAMEILSRSRKTN